MNKREIGSGYEEMAAAYLIEQGYKIIARNFSDRRGEIGHHRARRGVLGLRRGEVPADERQGNPPQKRWTKENNSTSVMQRNTIYTKTESARPCRAGLMLSPSSRPDHADP